MKRFGKIMSIVLSVGLIASVTAACGNSNNEGKGEGGEKVVKFWTHYQHDAEFVKKKVAEYNEAHKGKVKIDLNVVANDDYNNVLNLAFQNDDAPDLMADGPSLTDLVSQGFVAPLDDLMSDDMKKKMESYKVENKNAIDGKMYTMPFTGYNFRLVWNKDMFKAAGLDPEKPPKSYAELISYAKKLTDYGKTQQPKKYGFMLPTGETWIWWIYGNQMNYVNGKSHFDWKTLKYTYSETKPVLEMYMQMGKDGSLFPGGTQLLNDPARAQFSEGNAGMMLAANWDVGVFNDQFPAKIDWGVTTLPTIDGAVHGKTEFDGGSYLFINANSKVQKEAMEFYEYMLSDEFLVPYYEGGYGVPVYPEISEKSTNKPTKKGFAAFADTSTDGVYPAEPSSIEVNGAGYGEVYNDIISGNKNIDEALADLDKRYNEAVQKAIDEKAFDPKQFIVENFSPENPTGK